MQRRGKLFAALAAVTFALPFAAWGQTKDPSQTSGTAVPSRTNSPTSSQPQQPSSTQPSSTQSSPTRTPPRDSGIKVDPVQAAKTIIDIFGKKKKPKPQVEQQPVAVPEPEAAEPAALPPVEAPATRIPPNRSDTTTQQPVRREPAKPVYKGPDNAAVTQPAATVPVAPLPASEVLPQTNVEPINSSARPTQIAPQSSQVAATTVEEDALDWPWLAALAAITPLIALATKYFFFPSARFDLEFETGESRIIKAASPFASLPETSLELDFEWGVPSTPTFRLAPIGGHNE